MRQIIVTIKGGAATVATSGFKGAECLKETADLERALGTTTKDEKTPEYQRQASVREREHAKQR